MSLNFTALAHCDRVLSDEKFASQPFADALGVDLDVMNAQIDSVARAVDGDPGFVNLADEDFLLLRQRVMFELTCLGRAVRAPRVREIIRACLGFLRRFGPGEKLPFLSGPERMAIVAFAVALKEQRAERPTRSINCDTERPTRCINSDTGLAHGYSHYDPETLPAPSHIDTVFFWPRRRSVAYFHGWTFG